MTGIKEQIRKKKEELAKLEAELDWLENRPEDIAIAELIHEKTCTSNHTDSCGWLYDKWDEPSHGTKHRYLRHARNLMAQGYTLDKVEKLIVEYRYVTWVRLA